MANSYEHLTIFLLLSSCVSGRIGSESTYVCDLQLLNPKSTIPLGDREEGRILDCIQIGWMEAQERYGLTTGESAACSKTLSSECQITDQLTSPNDEYEFTKTIGNDTVGFKVNCKIEIDDDDDRHINVWQCGDDVIHRYYILQFASVPESTVSKRDAKSLDECTPERTSSCVAPMKELMEKSAVVATIEEELIKFCELIKPSIECLDDVLEECTKSGGISFDNLLSGFTSTFSNLCDVESQFSKDYLKHAPCMAEADERVARCSGVQSEVKMASSVKEVVETHCCSFDSTVTCARKIYNDHCGPEASHIGYQIAKTKVGIVVQDTCMDNHGNFKCSSCNSLLSMSHVMSLLSLATLFVIFRSNNHF